MLAPPSSLPVLRLAAAAGAGLGLAVLTGPGLPLNFGAAPALAALGLAGLLGAWRARALRASLVGGWSTVLAGLDPGSRWILVGVWVLPAVIVAASVVRAIAGLCVAFPPAIAGLGVLVLLGLVPARRRLAGVVLALLAGSLALAAVVGAARFEAAGPSARGFAHGGPILGIHPFQSTAIVIDGYGPFDLPINDYVEPDGSRGYGPAALAEALERDLRAIADLQFADGPARAWQAFAGARVEAVVVPAVQERRDRPPDHGPEEPSLVVYSGNYGPGSRVEFVCPGSRNDPRPRGQDPVMERMCPDKYAAEASAGLGLTGRWTGYTEGRGNPRISLAGLLGWSRVDESTRLWEPRLWAWLVLVLLGGLALRPAALGGLARGAGALALAGGAVFTVMVVWTWPSVQVDWLAHAPTWRSPWSPTLWAPALALLLVIHLGGARSARAAALPGVVVGLVVGVTSWALAGRLAALGWASRGPTDGLEGLVRGIGEALQQRTAIDLQVAEAIAATTVLAGLLALLAAVLGPLLRRTGELLAPLAPSRRSSVLVLLVVLSGLLVLSRKTVGGAALLGPALALALAGASGLTARVGGRGGWSRTVAAVDHGLSVALVLWAASEAWAERDNPMMAAWLLIGVAMALVSLVLLRRPTAVRSPQEAPQGPVAP